MVRAVADTLGGADVIETSLLLSARDATVGDSGMIVTSDVDAEDARLGLRGHRSN